jgi:hypothetical protein
VTGMIFMDEVQVPKENMLPEVSSIYTVHSSKCMHIL